MPPEAIEQHAGEIYQLFNENFGKIKVLLAENRTVLEREVFRPLKTPETLTPEEISDFKEFANALANTHTLEMVDVQLSWMIFRDLYHYYKKLYEETADPALLDDYILCLFKVITVGYNVIQNSDKGRATNALNERYRKVSIEAEEVLISFVQNPETFARLSVESRSNILSALLFRGSIYERLYYDEEMVRKQIFCYEELLLFLHNPQIQAAAPEVDFAFEEFSVNSYLSLVDEYLYWNKVPEDILLRLKQAAEDALAYARENKNYRQNEETLLGTLHTIQGYLGEISIPEMLKTYVDWLKGADSSKYDWMSVENNLLPVLYTFWLCEARPEWTDICRDFLLEGQRQSFAYIKNSRDKGAYECMQRFTSYIMNSYIELEGGVPFRQYYENILAATQPTLYVHCRMVTKISLALLDELYRQRPDLLLYVNGCETLEEVHASIPQIREFLFYCGMFHDAGKLYFLDTINLFARALFNEEFDLIRLHPQMGWELLNKWDSTRPYAEAALYHHLWYDEKGGYPREYTYKGNDNAILYQILTCADCLDAATDSVGRAYSSGKNFQDMLIDLRCNAGRMFNPDLVKLFDSESLQHQIEHLITAEREQLYREVFGKNVTLVL